MASIGIQARWTEIHHTAQLAPIPQVESLVTEATEPCPLTFLLVEVEVTAVAPPDPMVQCHLLREIIIGTCLKNNVNKASVLVDMIVGRGCLLEVASRRPLFHHITGVLISSIHQEASGPCKVCPCHETTLYHTIPCEMPLYLTP